MLGVDLHEDAGRAAYLASFHAAQALLFDKTGKVFKTHKGVQAEFLRLTKDDPRWGSDLAFFCHKPTTSRLSPITRKAKIPRYSRNALRRQ